MAQGDGEVGRVSRLCEQIIGACIEVHRSLGPGLLESAYEQCLCRELSLRSIPFQRQVPLPVKYKGVFLDCGNTLDLIAEGRVVMELKAVEKVLVAQLLTYLKLTAVDVGLLINFNVPALRHGVRRITRRKTPPNLPASL